MFSAKIQAAILVASRMKSRPSPGVNVKNCLATLRPNLAAQWHPTLNQLTPDQVTLGSTYKAFWKCPDHHSCDEHIWPATVNKRVIGGGCPFCAGFEVCPCNCFPNTDPGLYLEFDHDSNPGLDPFKLTRGRSVEINWKCSKAKCDHHKWPASLVSRTTGCGCPFCAGYEICPCNSLAVKTPELLTEWNFVKNSHLDPYRLGVSSTKIAWWICSICGHNWQCKIYKRQGDVNVGCSRCSSSKGEKVIMRYLQSRNLRFEKEYVVCIHGHSTRFDFVVEIPYHDRFLYLLVEFDGEQHFKYVEYFHRDIENYQKGRQRDLDKNQYCFQVGLPLLRIHHLDIDVIPEILDQTISNIEAHTFYKLLQPSDDYYNRLDN